MALVSPGVQVSVIDESFYTPAEPGTVPMIFVASAQDKTSSSGTGTASGTTAANAGKVNLITSQRELAETFGDPTFTKDGNNNPIHGGELNEWGLQAAYSYLGVANRAYIVRAAVDTGELNASATTPAANPPSGTYWLDTANTEWGVFVWNGNAATTTGGQTFTKHDPIVITDKTNCVGGVAGAVPKTSIGAVGDYAINATTTYNDLYFKKHDGTWQKVASAGWKQSNPAIIGATSNPTITNGATMSLNGATVTASGTTLDALVTEINTNNPHPGIFAKNLDNKLALYSDGSQTAPKDTKVTIAEGSTLMAEVGITASTGDGYKIPSYNSSTHTNVPAFKGTLGDDGMASGAIWLKTTSPNLGANWKVKKFNDTTKLWEDVSASLYSSNESALYSLDLSGGGVNLPVGTLYVNTVNGQTGEADFKLFRRANTGSTTITSSAIATQLTAATYAVTIEESIVGAEALASKTISVTTTAATTDADVLAGKINDASFTNVSASVDALNRVVITHNDGGEIKITDTDGLIALAGITQDSTNVTYEPGIDPASPPTPRVYRGSNWGALTHNSSSTAPTSLATDGQLWYSSIVDQADIMEHTGAKWDGYLTVNANTDPAGPQVSATAPTTQSDATALVDRDLWIDSSDLENYPKISRWNASTLKWVAVDNSDQTTEDGIVFADGRSSTAGADETDATIVALLTSDFVDTDAPDPALYPKGTLLFNTRRSGFNVKKFARNHVDTTANNLRMGSASMSGYYAHRWVTESANNSDGSGSFGRRSQRKVVVQSLQALVNANQEIRDDESRIFNVVACPGYPELIGELVSLNNDRNLSAFIVGDSPMRLTSDATSLNNWATNVSSATEDNDNGLVTNDDYLGVFYPSGFTSDNFGNNVVVPPSHMMLRTIALSDQVSFPWFAPAGTRRGGITNASSTGYIDSEGEFVSSPLNEGQRDTLYSSNVNPLTFITGAGLVNYGQKTRAGGTSSLDRINVSRLVIYLRSQLNKLARPFVFEPNDKITRDEIKAQADSLLLELVGNRALYDFLVVCDESNNTPSRIDRNELYLDIAIEPVKAIEFIYIPLRLKNTGEIAGL